MSDEDTHNGHHKYGPSQLEMYENCPCYKPDDTRDTTAADEGTLCHKAAEEEDVGILDTDEQVVAVNKALEVKHDIIAEYGPDPVILQEEKVMILNLTEGTLDLLVADKDMVKAHLLDYKFGRMKVTEAAENGQVQAYVAGAFEKFPTLQEITASLYFPRLEWITTATYIRSDLDTLQLRIAAIIARAKAEYKVPHPTEKSCQFCGDKANCKAMHEFALNVGATLPVPIHFELSKLADPEEIAKALTLFSIIEDAAKQFRRASTKIAVEDGVEIPGFGIRSRQGAHKVTEVYDAVEKTQEVFGVTTNTIMQAMSLSIPKLSAVVAAFTGESKKEVREKLLDALEDCTIQEDTVTYLQRSKGKKNG